MSHGAEFIEDLQDAGFLSSALSAKIGAENLVLYEKQAHPTCSVNQSRLSGWSWLIGKEGAGVVLPMLCVTRQQYGCLSGYEFFDLFSDFTKMMIAFDCVLVMHNIFNLAVWCRVNNPNVDVSREAQIQMQLLGMFSGIDLFYTMALAFIKLFHLSDTTRVFSVFHAILLTQFANLLLLMTRCFKRLTEILNFLTAIYLVQHSAQRFLLFTDLRKSKFLFGIAAVICTCLSIPIFFSYGFPYCENSSVAYLLSKPYRRLSKTFSKNYRYMEQIIANLLTALTAILLIDFAVKRCCACSQRSITTFQGSEIVTYTRQVDAADDETGSCPQEVTIVDVGIQELSETGFTAELRNLIFWQQVVYCTMDTLKYLYYYFTLVTHRFAPIWVDSAMTFLHYIVLTSRLTVLSPLLSPMCRASYRAMFVELKDFANERLRWCRRRMVKRKAVFN